MLSCSTCHDHCLVCDVTAQQGWLSRTTSQFKTETLAPLRRRLILVAGSNTHIQDCLCTQLDRGTTSQRNVGDLTGCMVADTTNTCIGCVNICKVTYGSGCGQLLVVRRKFPY